MRNYRFAFFALTAILQFSSAPALADPWMGRMKAYDTAVWPEGRSLNYGVAKYFLDESKNEKLPIEIALEVYADGRPPSDLEVQLFSNVNRRDFAKVFEPLADADKQDSYWLTYPMSYAHSNGDFHVYRATISLAKTGAYRVTGRFRVRGGPWQWHNGFRYDGVAQRDGAIVVSPRKVLDRTLYEVNAMVVEPPRNAARWRISPTATPKATIPSTSTWCATA